MPAGETFGPRDEYEAEKASNGYLMSLVALMAGLPLPVLNLIATAFFYLAQRNATPFVRWHCMQALLAQIFLLPINACAVAWTLSIVFGSGMISNPYIAYMISAALFNIVELAATVYTAARTRKGSHVSWWLFGPATDLLVRT